MRLKREGGAKKRGATKQGEGESPPAAGEAQAAAPAAQGSREPMVGECVDHRHPTLIGRALIRWVDAAGAVVERWLPTLHGVTVRVADRVLLIWPANWAEPLITGVVDGFASRPEPQRAAGASLALRPDETIRVTTDDDACLLEVYRGESGPVVRLLQPDVEVELAGSLRLSAKSIALQAKQGEVNVQASGDVAVRGERIHLN
jgi:hypothetical protein